LLNIQWFMIKPLRGKTISSGDGDFLMKTNGS
jgi:hypothetical protein